MNDLLLKALKCENVGRPPVWLMRQAGRYMSAYRALREKYSFLEMCHNPELIAKVTQLPIRAYGFDAAILFSDILVIPEAMGLGLQFLEKAGPIIERPIKSVQDIEHIPAPDISRLDFVRQGIDRLKSELKVPLIGFCGAPFTIASYMIEGQSSKDLKRTKQWMLTDPNHFHRLLEKIVDWSVEYLNMQIAAGVDVIQIFDSWANFLGHRQFLDFSLHYFRSIISRLSRPIPVIVYCRGSSVFAPYLATIHPTCISLDWSCDITKMRQQIPYPIAIQGNLDPHILYGSKDVIEREVNAILDGMAEDKGFIFNLGHGILPDVPEESVQTLVDCVNAR